MGAPKKIMIIGAGAGQVPIIQQSQSRGLYTIVVSPKGNYPGIEIADLHINEDIYNKDKLVDIAKIYEVDYVISDQSDFAVPTIAYISEKLGLLGNTIHTAEIYSNKNVQREFCRLNNLKAPKSIKLTDENLINDIDLKFPLVVKPADSQGSRGILKVDTLEDTIDAFRDALNYSKEKEVIIEEYFQGDEIVCEGFVIDGCYYNIGFGDRTYFNIKNKFIPNKTIFPSLVNDTIKKSIIENERLFALNANAKFGIVHSEYLVNSNGEICMVETALRGGGVYISSHIIPSVYNIDLTKLLLDYIIEGKKCVESQLINIKEEGCCAYVCFYLNIGGVIKEVKGIEAIKNNTKIIQSDIDAYVSGYEYKGLEHKGNRLGPILIYVDSHKTLTEQLKWLKENYIIDCGNSANEIIWD